MCKADLLLREALEYLDGVYGAENIIQEIKDYFEFEGEDE